VSALYDYLWRIEKEDEKLFLHTPYYNSIHNSILGCSSIKQSIVIRRRELKGVFRRMRIADFDMEFITMH